MAEATVKNAVKRYGIVRNPVVFLFDVPLKDRLTIQPGEEIPLRIDPHRIHVFDGARS